MLRAATEVCICAAIADGGGWRQVRGRGAAAIIPDLVEPVFSQGLIGLWIECVILDTQDLDIWDNVLGNLDGAATCIVCCEGRGSIRLVIVRDEVGAGTGNGWRAVDLIAYLW